MYPRHPKLARNPLLKGSVVRMKTKKIEALLSPSSICEVAPITTACDKTDSCEPGLEAASRTIILALNCDALLASWPPSVEGILGHKHKLAKNRDLL